MREPASTLDVLFLLAMNQQGGAEQTLLRIASGMKEEGLRAGIAVYGAQAQHVTEASAGCPVFQLQTTHTYAALRPLLDVVRKTRARVIISGLRHPNLLSIICAKIAGTRVIVTEHSALAGQFAALRSWKHRAARQMMIWFYGSADSVVAVSEGIAAELRVMLGNRAGKVTVIYNPIVGNTPFTPTAPPHPWLGDKKLQVVMAVGRLSFEKGVDVLLRAFAQLTANSNARLIVAGDGPERAALQQMARELGVEQRVFFASYQQDVLRWLSHATLFVSPSRFEGFGNAIVEAMACGVPVIATDCPVGPAEILGNGKYGVLVPVGNVAALAGAMKDALASPLPVEPATLRAHTFSRKKSLSHYAATARRLLDGAPRLRDKVGSKLSAIFLQEYWMTGIIHAPIETSPLWKECPKVDWLWTRDGNNYLADPFPIPGSKDSLLCEEYSFGSRTGHISRIRLEGNVIAEKTREAFPVVGHLSFPFLFQHEGEIYCIPESGSAEKLAIYRKSAEGWQLYVMVRDSCAAADSVLFSWHGRFWIAYTDARLGLHDNLNLLYSYKLEGPWEAHAQNPVKRDIATSRNGGTPFLVGDLLYRPAQDCSTTYGGALAIMQVMECSPAHYVEKQVNHILPENGRNKEGLHTLSAWGERCLVDGKHLRFSLANLRYKLLKRISRKR